MGTPLHYATRAAAERDLSTRADGPISNARIALDRDGHLQLQAVVNEDLARNECTFATLDLVSGNLDLRSGRCVIRG